MMGVMNVSQNTKAFGQTTGEAKSAQDEVKNLSAQDLQKIGSEDIGAVLNKVADPNWVDPNRKMRAVGNPSLDKDAFFKLMLAQMKNQDPTNPLKSHEMAAQLASFSSLEQMQNMNTTLTELKSGQKPAEQFQTLNLIGKNVGGDSANLVRAKDDKAHDFRFNLMADASDVTVRVRNPEGQIIRTYELNNLKKGDNKITWNGQDDNGRTALPGEYNFFVEAKTADGKKLAVKTSFDGLITGVNFTNEGPILLIGNQTVRLRDVKKITDPTVQNLGPNMNGQNVVDVTSQDLKKGVAPKNTESMNENAALQNPQGVGQMMQNIGMSRDMMSKLAKETMDLAEGKNEAASSNSAQTAVRPAGRQK